MPEFTALLDPNWSTTQRLFHKSWKSWKWSKRMLPVSQPRAHLLFPEKMKRHLISISGSVALFTFSPFTSLRISGNFAVKKTSCFAARTGQLGWAVATAILHQADQKCPRHLKIHGIIWHSPFPLILIMAYIIYPISSNRKPGSVFDLFIFWSRLGYVISGGWQPRKTTKNH